MWRRGNFSLVCTLGDESAQRLDLAARYSWLLIDTDIVDYDYCIVCHNIANLSISSTFMWKKKLIAWVTFSPQWLPKMATLEIGNFSQFLGQCWQSAFVNTTFRNTVIFRTLLHIVGVTFGGCFWCEGEPTIDWNIHLHLTVESLKCTISLFVYVKPWRQWWLQLWDRSNL